MASVKEYWIVDSDEWVVYAYRLSKAGKFAETIYEEDSVAVTGFESLKLVTNG